MLKVLSRHLNVVEFGKSEFAQRVAVGLKILACRSSVELLFEFVSPLAQFVNVFVHGGLLGDKVFLKRTAYVCWQNCLGKLSDVGFGGKW